ncbi:MAG: hypothetical protein J6S85_12990 [Methanobrevibacter sp.]|nr:hypothetical protein [Methanobrevibacter sp.]
MAGKKNNELIENLTLALQSAFGRKPTDVSGLENITTSYYFNYLLRLVKGIFEVKMPDYWDSDFLLDTLLLDGVIGIFENNSEPLAMNCHPFGVNMYYKPTSFNIANPVLGSFTKTIGIDGELIYLEEVPGVNSQFKTIRPLLTKYAYQLAACDKCIDQSLMNSGVAAIFSASSKKAAESYRAMYDDISMGKPAVFVDEELNLTSPNSRNLQYTPAKDNFVCDKVQIEKRCIIEEFLTAIGVNNANTSKRERLNTDEVNSNNDECYIATAVWKRNLKETTDKAKKLFPSLEFSITIKDLSIIDNSPSKANPDEKVESKDDESSGEE